MISLDNINVNITSVPRAPYNFTNQFTSEDPFLSLHMIISFQVLLVVFGVIQAITKLDIGVVGDFSSLVKQFHRWVRKG